MRELVSESRECNLCGARVRVACGASDSGARAVTFAESPGDERPARATRSRSGLAHAAGFTGVVYLFGYSLAPLVSAHWWVASGSLLLVAWSLFAPLALALAFAAGVSLDRSRGKSGAMPALFGLVAGLLGTMKLLLVLALWMKYS